MEKYTIALLRYRLLAVGTMQLGIQNHPDVRDVETKLYSDFMKEARALKLINVN